MTTIIQYIVKTPIHGYAGMGYSHLSHITKAFNTEKAARKWKKHCDFFYGFDKNKSYFGEESEARKDEYYRHMTDNVSYNIKGISRIYKRIIQDEELK